MAIFADLLIYKCIKNLLDKLYTDLRHCLMQHVGRRLLLFYRFLILSLYRLELKLNLTLYTVYKQALK